MKLLYVVKKINEANIIDCHALSVIEETDTEYILLDHINIDEYVDVFPKEMTEKEYPLFFVTKDKRKLKKQIKRIYENISKINKEEIAEYEYNLKKAKAIQNTNEQNYNNMLNNI